MISFTTDLVSIPQNSLPMPTWFISVNCWAAFYPLYVRTYPDHNSNTFSVKLVLPIIVTPVQIFFSLEHCIYMFVFLVSL